MRNPNLGISYLLRFTLGLTRLQLPCRALGDILPLRRQSHRLRFRRRAGRTAERIPQIPHLARSGDAGAKDAETGHGGETGLEERAAS